MTYHDIEVIVTEDEKKMKLKGQIDDIHYKNPEITIFDREGDIGATKNPPYSMKLSRFIYEMTVFLESTYSFKELRPMKFGISINVGEAKK